VGNLPYSISSPFLKRLALLDGPREVADLSNPAEPVESTSSATDSKSNGSEDFKLPRAKWRSAVFLVQDEFAHKAAAGPSGTNLGARAAEPRHKQSATHGGGGSYGHLAVLLRAVSTVDLIGALVLPAAFNPPPAVNSRVLRLVRREDDMDVHFPPGHQSKQVDIDLPFTMTEQSGEKPNSSCHEDTVEIATSADISSDSGNGAVRVASVPQQWLAFVRLCWTAKRRTVRANLTAKGVLRRLDSNTTTKERSQQQNQKDALIAILDSPRFEGICSKRAVEVEPEAYRQLFVEFHKAGVVFPDTSAPRDAPELVQPRVFRK
jgi:16S rRNA A1518/A1519 N6-dimethyltransferase RsmA/KsgA/DIM1 with predicted DNA glycosylase/AP lyase activity